MTIAIAVLDVTILAKALSQGLAQAVIDNYVVRFKPLLTAVAKPDGTNSRTIMLAMNQLDSKPIFFNLIRVIAYIHVLQASVSDNRSNKNSTGGSGI